MHPKFARCCRFPLGKLNRTAPASPPRGGARQCRRLPMPTLCGCRWPAADFAGARLDAISASDHVLRTRRRPTHPRFRIRRKWRADRHTAFVPDGGRNRDPGVTTSSATGLEQEEVPTRPSRISRSTSRYLCRRVRPPVGRWLPLRPVHPNTRAHKSLLARHRNTDESYIIIRNG